MLGNLIRIIAEMLAERGEKQVKQDVREGKPTEPIPVCDIALIISNVKMKVIGA